MKWSEVKAAHPESWLVIEALESHHEQGRFVIDEVAVIETCKDGGEAFALYRELHRKHPEREFLYIHTSQEDLRFEERRWVGVRSGT